MNEVSWVYAFGAGFLATLNPCGFAMLPSFIAFYLGRHEAAEPALPWARRLAEVGRVGGLVTTGFLTVFILGGVLATLGVRLLFGWVPYVTIGIAVGLIALGGAMLLGRTLVLPIPHPQWSVRRRGLLPMYLYGVSYAVASLSCTLPVFLVVVGGAAAATTPLTSLLMLGTYGLGMAVVLFGVTLGAAFFEGVVTRWLRTLLPYVQPTGGMLMILVGLYLVTYQLYYLFA